MNTASLVDGAVSDDGAVGQAASLSDDAEERAEKEAFFRELERRHGGPLCYEELQQWAVSLEEDSDGLSDGEVAKTLPPSVGASMALPAGESRGLSSAGWMTPATPQPRGAGRLISESRMAAGDSDDDAVLAEDEDCVVTEAAAEAATEALCDRHEPRCASPDRASLASSGAGLGALLAAAHTQAPPASGAALCATAAAPAALPREPTTSGGSLPEALDEHSSPVRPATAACPPGWAPRLAAQDAHPSRANLPAPAPARCLAVLGIDDHAEALRAALADGKQLRQQVSEQRKQYLSERREWQAQAERLRAEVAQLRLRGGCREAVAAGGSLSAMAVDAPTLQRVEAEIREQETLIGAFQKENERLVEQLRAAREEARGAAAAVEAKQEEVRLLQLRASQAEVRHNDGAAEELQGHLERARGHAEAEAEQARQREVEMRADMDRLRAAKRDLEAKLAGVDLGRMESEHSELRDAQAARRRAEAEHAKEVGSLRSKLAWYVENQQLLDETEEKLGAARARIAQLEASLAAAGAPPPSPDGTPADAAAGAPALAAPPAGTSAAAAADALSARERERLRALEAQVGELQALLAKRRGGGRRQSVGELLAAVGPSPEQEARQAALQERLETLEAQHAAAEAGAQRRMRSLRQQHERVVAAHDARAAALEAQLKTAQAAAGEAGGRGGGRARVRELERQVEEVRATHGKRVRELEARLAEAERPKARAAKPGRNAVLACHRQAAWRPGGAAPPPRSAGAAAPPTPAAAPAVAAAGKAAARTQEAPPPQGAAPAPGAEPEPEDAAGAAAEHEAAAEAAGASDDDGGGDGGGDAEAPWAHAALEGQAALERVGALAEQLAASLAMLAPPGAVAGEEADPQLALLRAHVASLERRQQARELDAKELLARAHRIGAEEARRVEQAYEATLARKNAQIEAFRVDLDAIMLELTQLHAQQAEAVAAARLG